MKKKKQNDEAPLPAREAALRIQRPRTIPVGHEIDRWTFFASGSRSDDGTRLRVSEVGNPDFVASEPIYEGSGKAARVHEAHDRHSRLRAAVP